MSGLTKSKLTVLWLQLQISIYFYSKYSGESNLIKNTYFRCTRAPEEIVMKIKHYSSYYGDLAWIQVYQNYTFESFKVEYTLLDLIDEYPTKIEAFMML